MDPSILSTQRGIRAVQWSFVGLLATGIFQLYIVHLSGSVALLADTMHNFADASTAFPLWIAFALAKRKPNKRFNFGYGRAEDLAGLFIVFTILASALYAGWEAVGRFLDPQPITHLKAVAAAAVIGFIGNEAVALYRIRVGREIGSAALVADGHHARIDGLTSLAVLAGAIGVWMGWPLADPLVGIGICLVILWIVWEASKSVLTRILDGVEPGVTDEIRHAAGHVGAVREVAEVRARWIGHRMHAEVNVAVDPTLTVAQAHEAANEVQRQLLSHLPYLSGATIHVCPAEEPGEKHHPLGTRRHGE